MKRAFSLFVPYPVRVVGPADDLDLVDPRVVHRLEVFWGVRIFFFWGGGRRKGGGA